MVAQLEVASTFSTGDSPITRKYERIASSGGNIPVSPDKFIKSERSRVPLGELLSKSAQELEELGVPEEDLINLLLGDTPEDTLVALPEKQDASLEDVMEWGTAYWSELNTRLARRMERLSPIQSKEGSLAADARIRALGAVTFVTNLENYTSPEVMEDAARVMSMATDLFIMAELTQYSESKDVNLYAYSLNSMVRTGLVRPDLFDRAVALANVNIPENLAVAHELESIVLGIKSELITAKILSEFDIPDEGTGVTITKPYSIRDVLDASDFVISYEQAPKNTPVEFCIVDVRKCGKAEPTGACRVYPGKGDFDIYQGNSEAPYLRQVFDIEPSFYKGILDRRTSGLVVRLPHDLVARYTATQIAELDKTTDSDYNDAKSMILSELKMVYERSTN